MQRTSVDLGSGRVGQLLFRLALPTITSQIVNMLYNLVDRVYIGHMAPAETVGKLALTGVGVCLPIIMLITAFSALAAMGAAPKATIEEGRGNRAGAEEIMGGSFTLLVVLAVTLTAVFEAFGRPLLLTFGASEATIGYAMDYLQIYILGTLFVQLSLGMNAFITAQGFTTVGMKTVLIGAVLNTILDPIFIFALDLGVRGAALATVLSQCVSMLWVLRFLRGKETHWRLRRETMRLRARVILPCVGLGLSPFIMMSTESVISVCFNSSLLKYGGNDAVASMTVLTSVMQLALLPLSGLTQGAQPILSYNFGAGKTDRVRQAFRALALACLTYSLSIWALVQLFPGVFIGMFNRALIDYASPALRLYMGATGIFGVQIACQQTFIALGNAKASLFLALLRKIILLVPLIYLLPCFFADKVFAVLLAEPAADVLAVCATSALFYRQFRAALRRMDGGEPA